ncbi:hypothetical protein F7725_009374 [Dissostichus mawsoni]|uniref:Calcitonin gene-related peptide type 1 receptor n=1 Tax=Dissostichus mawsoni TaxID=36200 RepID=A0A7J5Z6Z0_DISMA|nr:hypothetical protein F7725_009374 [Dissostichus mawsoni]
MSSICDVILSSVSSPLLSDSLTLFYKLLSAFLRKSTMERNCVMSLLVFCTLNKLLVVATPEEDLLEHLNHSGEHRATRNQIATAQYECFQRMVQDSHRRTKSIGPVCNTTWDGWLCWDETEAGPTEQSSMASKVCSETGEWGRHPESNRTWTNFTICQANTTHHGRAAMTHFYLVMIGHGLSLVSLSCQRITLHKNLFLSFVLNSIITVVWLTTVVKKQGHTYNDSVCCKLLMFIHLYLLSCNYFWMLCEGIYLHTLIVVAVRRIAINVLVAFCRFSTRADGDTFDSAPLLLQRQVSLLNYDDHFEINHKVVCFMIICWVSSDTSLLYIIHGPICAALVTYFCQDCYTGILVVTTFGFQVNLFFLLNIVRVLITKLRVTHQAESSLYMRAVRATLILIPLLGIQFVLLPYKPQDHWVSEIYLYVMEILMHYQGLLVSTIFCFFNGEVQSVLRRNWNQQRMQFSGTFANADFFRSASYVASSLTEVHRCYSIESHTEHMNGKSYSDIFRSDSPFV